MDHKGYIIGATAFLMIIPAVLISLSLINLFYEENTINSQAVESNSISYAFVDINRNIPIFTRQILETKSEQVIQRKEPLINSSKEIKRELEYKINNLNNVYNGLNITYIVESVQLNQDDPFYIEVKSKLCVKQGNITHEETFSQLVSIEGLKDPLPFIKCGDYGNIDYNQSNIIYRSNLKIYLEKQKINNSIYYQNATSPLIIKKCHYEPYSNHGNPGTLKNCLDNGYFHKSQDGACYLCRLEGKSTCIHYGIETFILPSPLINSSDLNNTSATCSIDHVIFGEDKYPGELINYFQTNGTIYVLFLEKGHKSKYGFLKN